MKLYLCFTTSGGKLHPCAKAYNALVGAGHSPVIEKVNGSRLLPGVLQPKGRKKVKALTGNYMVPTLELNDGSIIDGSENIVKWALDHKH